MQGAHFTLALSGGSYVYFTLLYSSYHHTEGSKYQTTEYNYSVYTLSIVSQLIVSCQLLVYLHLRLLTISLSMFIFNVSLISCLEVDRTSPPHPQICMHNYTTLTGTQSLTFVFKPLKPSLTTLLPKNLRHPKLFSLFPNHSKAHTHQPQWQAALNRADSLLLVDSLMTCPGPKTQQLL